MTIDICLSPALYSFYDTDPQTTVVIVDIFRASTTICAAMDAGAGAIIPVQSIEEAEAYKAKGLLAGAERNVARCDFADFGNSPYEYTADRVQGKEIAFTTTNGTQALKVAEDAETIIIGAFTNLKVVADYCVRKNQNVMVLCAGWNNKVNLEDTLFGGALTEIFLSNSDFTLASDAGRIALSLWQEAKADIKSYLTNSEHIHRLMAHHLEKDIDFCLNINTSEALPIYDKKTQKLMNYNALS
jgi:2-phosphosulfolactate phosphatase